MDWQMMHDIHICTVPVPVPDFSAEVVFWNEQLFREIIQSFGVPPTLLGVVVEILPPPQPFPQEEVVDLTEFRRELASKMDAKAARFTREGGFSEN